MRVVSFIVSILAAAQLPLGCAQPSSTKITRTHPLPAAATLCHHQPVVMSQRQIISILAPAIFVLLWASGFVVTRLIAGHVEPISFLAFRFPLAALCMLALTMMFQRISLSPIDGAHAATVGFFLHAGYLACIYWAVTHGLPGGVAALIAGLQPLITAFMAVPMIGERVAGKHWLGLAVGLLGVALVLWPKFSIATINGITPVTAGTALVGIIFAAFGTVYQKRFAAHLPLAQSMFWQYVGASAAVVVLAALTENFHFDGSLQAWSGLAWAVVISSVCNILILMYLIREGAVAKVSALIFLVPGVAAIITWLMFDETLNLVQITGMAVTAAAVIIVNRSHS
jgi:drug/metabolite transporter (DMT)-like permease